MKQTDAIAVGIVTTTEPQAVKAKLAAFAKGLAAATGIREVSALSCNYYDLLSKLKDGSIQMAWLPPFLAHKATTAHVCVPVALPVRYGLSSYSAALFCKPDSPFDGIHQLKGLHACWVAEQSASGYLLIRSRLRALGVDLDRAFAKNTFGHRHDAVAERVLHGDADVGASFVHFGNEAQTDVKHAGWGDADVRILCSVGPIPSDFVAVSNHTTPELRKRLAEALLADKHPELRQAALALLGCTGLVAPTAEHRDALLKLLKNQEAPLRRHSLRPLRP
jgi:phosphonate transport system substrate-binding protein